MTDLLSELDEIPKWVKLVRDALVAADVTDANGEVHISAQDLTLRMIELAGGEKTFNDLANSREISVAVPQVGTIPPDSGYVNDPVCTATGHLLVDARDFAMPPRLDILSFRRTYASQQLRNGAFGPGWWSWTECRSAIAADGSFEYFGPDALEFVVPIGADGRFIDRQDLDVHVERLDQQTVQIRWGRRSRNPNQIWTFSEGRLLEVAGPFVGRSTFSWDRRGRLTAITHDSGRSLTLRWRGRRVTTIVSSDGRRAAFEYNKPGALVGVDNARSPERYDVDAQGRILSITDADGIQTITMTYDDDGRVVAQVSETGLMTRFNYDEPRRTTLSDRDYNPLSVYTHDGYGRVEMYATAGGYRFTRRFDKLGRVVSQRDADGTSFTLVDRVDGGVHVEEVRWSTGEVERFEYDTADRLVRQSSATSSSTFRYVGGSMFPSRIDVAGDHGLSVELDWNHGSPTRIADSDGVVDDLTVRRDGTIESVTDALGHTTHYDVDACGFVTRIVHPDGSTVRYERDAAGRLLAVVNAKGQRGEVRYSPAGRVLAAIEPSGAVTSLEYDETGLPARLVAADGNALGIAFDDKQRVVGVRFANGDSIGLELDEFGRQVAIETDDRRWTTERDASGRIVRQSDPSGAEIAQQYGEAGGWMTITDAAGANWRLERDLVNRVRTLTTPSGRRVTAEYSAEGFLTSQTADDGRDQEISYTAAGRVAAIATGDEKVEFRYDAAGRMVGANTGTGWWTFDLDSNGRIVRRVSPAGREQRYGYNVLDQLTSISVAGEIWSFAYDTASRLLRSTDPTGRTSTYDYDPVGRMIESHDGLGTPVRYAYDPRGRIAAMVDGHDGAIRYEHNALNQLTAVTDQLGRRTNVQYDDAGRHVTTTWLDPRRSAPGIPTREQFGLDGSDDLSFGDGVEPLAVSTSPDGLTATWTPPTGDRIELRRDADGLTEFLGSPGFTRTWARDACGRVTGVVDVRNGERSITTLRRDAAGRVVDQEIDGVVTQYGYDDAGQLVSSSSPSGLSTWEYDGLGRLAWERTPDTLRSFRYDAAHQLVELTENDAVTTFEYDARGRRVRAHGAQDLVYVWGERYLEAVVVDGVLRRFDTDAEGHLRRAGDSAIEWDTSFVTPRPLAIDGRRLLTVDASTVGAIGTDGSVDWRPFKLTDAWGGDAAASGAATWHDYFGVEADGLVWLGARPYDVATRQFLAPDPLAPVPGTPGSTSPYTYAANDPINLFDPTGRQPISIEAWNDVRDRRTGPQWQNIASVAIAVVAVAVTVVTLGTAGPVAMVLGGAAIGALAGGASGLARESIESNMHLGDGEFNGGAIIKDVVIGAAGGALGGGMGAGFNALAGTARVAGTGFGRVLGSRGGSAATEVLSGLADGALGETYDVTMPRNWGADGSWDNGAIVTNTVLSGVAGGALHGVGGSGHHGGSDAPTTASADPSTLDLPASPTPNAPDPSPASTAASASTGSDTTTVQSTDAGSSGGAHDTNAGGTDTGDTSTGDASGARHDTNAGDSGADTTGTAADTSETAADTTADTPDTSTDTTTDTSDTVTDTTDTSTETTADTSDTSTDTTADTSDATGDTPDTSTDTTADTSDATGDTPDTSPDATTDTSDATGDTSDTSTDTITDTSDATTDTTDTQTDTPGSETDTSATPTDSSDATTDPSAQSDTSDTSTEATNTSDGVTQTPQANTDAQTDTPDASTEIPVDASDVDTDTSGSDTEAGAAAAAAVAVPTAAATSSASASSAASAQTGSSPGSSSSNADTPASASNNGGDPPSNNGDTSTNMSDSGAARLAAVKADPRNTSVRTDSNGMTRITRQYGPNKFEFTVDADGFTRAVKFEVDRTYKGLPRNSGETRAQNAAVQRGGRTDTDQGGHMAGHRFSENQGDINQIPQDANFNNGAYRTFENEMAAWTRNGYTVEGTVHADQTDGARPDTVEITYVVSDADGNVVHYGTARFDNESGQTFDRVPTRDMRNPDVLYEGRPPIPGESR